MHGERHIRLKILLQKVLHANPTSKVDMAECLNHDVDICREILPNAIAHTLHYSSQQYQR